MENHRAQLVPELLVTNLSASLKFWIDVCGFSVMYSREADGFFYLDRAGAQVMLVEARGENGWITAPLDTPLGRGINFEIKVDAVAPIFAALEAAGYPLFRPVQEQWYRSGAIEIGVREFLVQDPDGYLLRFSARIGERPH